MKSYAWAPGSRVEGDAQAVGERLAWLAAQNKARGVTEGVSAEEVVEDARDRSSPLHPLIEWDDAEAAAAYRLEQARLICRSVYVVPEPDERRAPIRALVAITQDRGDGPEQVYMPTEDAMANDETRAQVLGAAMRELRSFRRKYSRLAELARVFQVIDQLELDEQD